jgi:type I restriction enzyme S subunit
MYRDWRKTRVDAICDLVSVGIVVQPAQYYVSEQDGVRAFRSGNVGENRVIDRDWVYLSREGHEANSKSILRTGDVLVVRSGAPGTACVVTQEYDGTNCIDIVFARPDKAQVVPEYLAELTNSPVGRKHVLGRQGGLALKHFNVGAYKQLEIMLPPLAEQHKITGILRTWDEAIDGCTRLIDLREQQQKALTHQLVFGSLRLPNFAASRDATKHRWFALPSDWDVRPIGELASEISEKNAGNSTEEVLSCSKYDGFVRSLEYFKKQVFSANLAGYKKIWRGDFGFPANHVEEGSIGLQNLTDVGVVSPIYTVFRFDETKIDNNYAFSVLKTSLYRHIFDVSTSASVDRRGSLRWKEFAKLPFPVPPIPEQRAIHAVLTEGRSLIVGLKAKREALERQKRGLMQKLLTGDWRVNVGDGHG